MLVSHVLQHGVDIGLIDLRSPGGTALIGQPNCETGGFVIATRLVGQGSSPDCRKQANTGGAFRP